MNFTEVLQIFLQKINFFEAKNTVDYVCGNGEALPLPLSAEEECETLRVMAEGEERRGGQECWIGCRSRWWPDQ